MNAPTPATTTPPSWTPRRDGRISPPPRRRRRRGCRRGLDGLAQKRREHGRAALGGLGDELLCRIGPGVIGEDERAPMNWDQDLRAAAHERVEGSQGAEVNVGPGRVPLPDLDARDVAQ